MDPAVYDNRIVEIPRLTPWAIREGRQAAHAVDLFLMGSTVLPR
jgi:hypothetical protein